MITWQTVLADVEREISKTQQRLNDLLKSKSIALAKIKAGESFPVLNESQQAREDDEDHIQNLMDRDRG